MRLFYGPSDVISAAASVKDGVTATVDDLVGLVELVGRGADLMARAEALLAHGEALAARADALLTTAEKAAVEADVTAKGAAAVVVESDAVAKAAARAVARAEALLATGEALLTPLTPLVTAATPVAEQGLTLARRVVESTQAVEVEALVATIDRLPQLQRHLERDILPLLENMGQVGPDVHDLLESVEDISRAVKGMPGMGLLRRRGERIEEEEEQEQARDDAAAEHA